MNDHNPSGNWDGSDDSGPMTDRPTGPATAADMLLSEGVQLIESAFGEATLADTLRQVDAGWDRLHKALREAAAAERARILAALAEALHAILPGSHLRPLERGSSAGVVCRSGKGHELEAAALAAAIEKLVG